MSEYILFMHQDAPNSEAASDPKHWARYFTWLRSTGKFDGGSSIGQGECLQKGQLNEPGDTDLSGFIRVRAANLEEAKAFIAGSPVYEAGGTVEIRELPRM